MIKKYITPLILFLAIFSLTANPVYADDTEYHEDPGIAEQIFSGISLLYYYSDSLDTILQKDPGATETALEKMPFANIPQELDIATGDFAIWGIALSHSITNLFDLWQKQNELLRQYQLAEAGKLGKQIAEGLPQARDQLAQLTYAVESTGSFLNIDSASPQGELKLTYDEIMDKLRQLGDMLDLLGRPLFDIGVLQSADQDKLAEVLGITPEQLQDLLKPENIDELLNLLLSVDQNALAELLGITPEQLQDLLKPENINELLDLLLSVDQNALAELLGITPEQLQDLLKPENINELLDLLLSVDQDALAELLGITPEQLQDLLKPENIDELLDLLLSVDQNALAELLGITPEQLQDLLKPENINELLDLLLSAGLGLLQEIFEPTILTLVIEPLEAFVGDEVNIKVVLTSNDEPLGNRDINIIFNSAQYITITTDAYGYYESKLKIPYWYIPEIEVQAIYYPEAQDIGTYLGSASEVINLAVKYYAAKLEISVDGRVYPGSMPILSGRFDYGQSPLKEEREILFYLDDIEIDNFNAPVSFEIPFNLASNIELGKHTLTILSPAEGRYAPVITNYIMEVTQAATMLDLNTSSIAIIPGNIDLTGKLYSEVGPLEDAFIAFKMDNSVTQIYSSRDGSFTSQIKIGMGLSLLGYQQMIIQIQPTEPWNAPSTVSRNIFVINVVNCGIILVTLAVLSLFLRFKLRKHSIVHYKIPAGLIENIPPVPVSVFETRVDTDTVIIKNTRDNDTPFTSIIKWYIRALKLVQEITLAVLKPQQTLREYAAESSQKLGLIANVFFEFTYLIERLIYSSYKPTHKDLEKSRELSHAIKKEGLNNEII